LCDEASSTQKASAATAKADGVSKKEAGSQEARKRDVFEGEEEVFKR
jgi:hypothetical protein